MLVNMKTYPALLWSISFMLSVESRSATASPPSADSANSTIAAQFTTEKGTTSSPTTNPQHGDADQQPHPTHPERTLTETPGPSAKPEGISAPTTPESIVSSSARSTQSPSPDADIRSTSVRTATSSALTQGHVSTVPPAQTAATQHPHTENVTEPEKPTGHPSQQHTATTSADRPVTVSSTEAVSSLHGKTTFTSDVTPTFSSTTPNSTPIQFSPQGVNSTTAVTPTSTTAGLTTGMFHHSPTSGPANRNVSFATHPQHSSSTFQPISPTSTPLSPSDLSNATTPGSPTGSPPTTYHTTISNISENVSTTATSNTSSGGGVIHRIPKRLPEMTTKSPSTTTTAPPKETGRDSVVSKCLIAIAALAGMATFFMVTTIILCTKLSSRKYHYSVRDSQQGTEMVCISALLSDRSCPRPSRYHPISNGVLLPSTEGDSDEDGGDNLTLSSFLPDSDRV